MFEERIYRNWVKSQDLICFKVTEYETDLMISADKNLEIEAKESVKIYRKQILEYIKKYKEFELSLEPIEVEDNCPEIIKAMADAGEIANVGPFAAVAGAMSEYVGKDLLKYSGQVIIENGGDIFIKSNKDRIIAIYAGESPLTGKIGLKIKTEQTPLGVCTSSGTVGHSLSFGRADAVIITSKSTSLADAVATASANIIQTKDDIDKAIEFASSIEGITGAIAIIGKDIGIWGEVEVVKT